MNPVVSSPSKYFDDLDDSSFCIPIPEYLKKRNLNENNPRSSVCSDATITENEDNSKAVADGGDRLEQYKEGDASFLSTIVRWLGQQWFLLSLFFAIIFAYCYPDIGRKGGPLKPEITSSYICVAVMFLLTGWSLRTRQLGQAMMDIHIHIITQMLNLGIFPIIAYLVSLALRNWTSLSPTLIDGIVVMACLPTTVSFCVAITAAMGGNEASSLVNSALGNILGIFVTPSWLFFLLGLENNQKNIPGVSFSSVMQQLFLTVVIPLIVGQTIQFFCPKYSAFMKQRYISVPKVCGVTLIYVVWTTFCTTFHPVDDGFDETLSMIEIVMVSC